MLSDYDQSADPRILQCLFYRFGELPTLGLRERLRYF